MLLCTAALAAVAPSAANATTVNNPLPSGLFSPTSFWNTPLSSTTGVDPSSSTLVKTLLGQISTYKTWINTYKCSSPVYVVPSSQPKQKVILDSNSSALSTAFASVPLPSNPKPAAGTDMQLTVWQPSTNSMWDFWVMYQKAGRWHARWGGKMTGVSNNPGYFSPPS